MDFLILKDDLKVQIEAGSTISEIIVMSATKEEMIATWSLFTKENLKAIKITNDNDVVIGEYTNLVLDSETSFIQNDGMIRTHFNLREKTELEMLREEVEALKAGQEVQDGAIVELAEIIGGE